MTKVRRIASRSVIAALLVCGAMPAAPGGDLSKYRSFELGTDLAVVAAQAGTDSAHAKLIQTRPALIQELVWRPQPMSYSARAESAQDVVLSFYDGALFRIAINYDRYETEGLTAGDMVEAISASYGTATRTSASIQSAADGFGEQEDVLAQWQDSQYGFTLIRSSYGPTFRLVGVLKRLEASAQASILEARRLDEKEAPQRDAARLASEEQTAKTKLEKARLKNKPKFRP